jgi:hypothetical protein
MRFAYRPILEIPLSYRVLKNPEYQPPYHKWVEEACRCEKRVFYQLTERGEDFIALFERAL